MKLTEFSIALAGTYQVLVNRTERRLKPRRQAADGALTTKITDHHWQRALAAKPAPDQPDAFEAVARGGGRCI